VGARRTRLYPWDGVEFTDRSAPYFIIAASVKTRVEAEEFIRQRKLGGEAEIRPSGHYPKLTPGYFIVVLARGQNAKDATKVVARYQKDGIPCYAKRAF
jgi:hypothetical protein